MPKKSNTGHKYLSVLNTNGYLYYTVDMVKDKKRHKKYFRFSPFGLTESLEFIQQVENS